MASDTVIHVENISKKYVIGRAASARSGDGLRHAISDAVVEGCRWLGAKLRNRNVAGNSSELSAHRAFQSSPLTQAEDFYALKDVSFEVKRGTVLGIVGRNGAGKSTLLKILSRITEPTRGRIGIKGRVASLLEVGTGFHPELTGRENIYLNGAILGMTRAEVRSKFDEIVDFANVAKFLDTPVKRYSSGMYVRLAFAVAAHLEPEILVVDEVLAVGDAEFQSKCLGKMKQVAQGQGRTVLFVSHNLSAIQSLCDKSLILDGGEVRFAGCVHEGLKVYRSSTRHGTTSDFSVRSDKPVRLRRVAFIGPDGIESSIWDTAKVGCFRVAYTMSTAAPRLELSLRLEGMTNGMVGTIFAGRSAIGSIPKHEGDHEVNLHVDRQPFVPDEYSITAWLHDPMVELFDYHEKVLNLEVLNSGCDFAPLGSASLLGACLVDPQAVDVVTPCAANRFEKSVANAVDR